MSVPYPGKLPPQSEVEVSLSRVISPRKVSKIVYRGGKRVRGHTPSIKGSNVRFDSNLESIVLLALETATSTVEIKSHPFVLRLACPDKPNQHFHYTPDAVVSLQSSLLVVETKGSYLRKSARARLTVSRASRSLRALAIPFALVVAEDIEASGLGEELRELMRYRPIARHPSQAINPNGWNPCMDAQPAGEFANRWLTAQSECNALLERVMRRDPDEFIGMLTV